MSGASREDSAERLERAVDLYVRQVESGGADGEGLIARHGDLLEPMLESGRDGGRLPARAPLAEAELARRRGR